MDAIVSVFRSRWLKLYGRGCSPGEAAMVVNVTLQGQQNTEHLLGDGMDESYSLKIRSEAGSMIATVDARSPFGARHALETLSQLIIGDPDSGRLMVMSAATIRDRPAFPYRGISLDTSRHFYPESVLMRLIDGLSYNKMNAFHLHLTDSQSFPVEIISQPNMSRYGAYGPGRTYSPLVLRRLHSYAYYRGVRLIPEVDAPSHVAYGWEWGPAAGKGHLLLCKQPTKTPECLWPPCGMLNPLNDNVYEVLEDIYAELLKSFDGPPLLHIGGSEVHFSCWRNSSGIREWLTAQGMDPDTDQSIREVWAHFTRRALQALRKAGKDHLGMKPKPILWTSTLTDMKQSKETLGSLADDLIIEHWGDSTEEGVPDLVAKGYKVIVANRDAWCLECGGGSLVGEDSNQRLNDWPAAYANRPYEGLRGNWSLAAQAKSAILGGEGCLWSHTVGPESVEARLWPRGAAIGERLWTDPDDCWRTAAARLAAHARRLRAWGVRVERLHRLAPAQSSTVPLTISCHRRSEQRKVFGP